MTKVILAGYYGYGNLGDDLLLHTVIENLPSSIREPEFTYLAYGILADQSMPKWQRLKTFIANCKIQMQNRDWLIFGGGTTFHSNMWLQWLVCKIAKRQGLRIAAIGIGTDAGPFTRPILRSIVAMCECFLVRDRLSLSQAGKKARLTADLVFAKTEQFIPYPATYPQRTIGISLIPGADTKFIHIWEKLHYPDNCRLIMFECQDGDIPKYLPRYVQVRKLRTDPIYLAKDFADVEIVLGMRLHTLIVAAMLKIPFVGINHSSKIAELCKAFNMPCLPLNATSSEILQAVNSAKIDKPRHQEALNKSRLLALYNFSALRHSYTSCLA